MFDLRLHLQQRQQLVDRELDRLLPPAAERPRGLHEAMRYSLFAGGKRLRPALCMSACEAAGGRTEQALKPAAAIECLHTYTLIHDDLPAMDNDILRRGMPTAHVKFGEANAILAGDALLTLAFEILAGCPAPPPHPPGQLALELAVAAGSRGVAGGQYEDLANEKRAPDPDTLDFIHVHKTAILIQASCRMGAIAAGAEPGIVSALGDYGLLSGLAFQIADDILDSTSTAEQLGKSAGIDSRNQKMTYVALYGIEASRARAADLIARAIDKLKGLPGPVEPLAELARYIVAREN